MGQPGSSLAMVVGHGMIGKTIVRDLLPNFDVVAADKRESALLDCYPGCGKYIIKKLSDLESIVNDIKPDIIIGALPGSMGCSLLDLVVNKIKRPYIDVSFMPENPIVFSELAKQANIPVIVDMGLAPGLGNMCIGQALQDFDSISDIKYYVGGLPKYPRGPTKYITTWSTEGVIQEYTTNARLIRNGNIISMPALSEVEEIDFELTGTLEAFNTDGLRTLVNLADDIPNISEKTLRWPGHAQSMKNLRDMGFFSEIPDKHNVTPKDITTKVLGQCWAPKSYTQMQDIVVMRIVVKGMKDKEHICRTYELYDEFDIEEGQTAMARTTAFACTAIANYIIKCKTTKTPISPGLYTPEMFVQLHDRGEVFKHVVEYLERRNVLLTVRESASIIYKGVTIHVD